MLAIEFTPQAWDDFQYWQAQDKKTLKRVLKLIEECAKNPFEGIGRPEPLKHTLSGCYSRRIDDCNRMVYMVKTGSLKIIQLRYHY